MRPIQTIGKLSPEETRILLANINRYDQLCRTGEVRADAGETAFLPRELLGVDPKQYQELFSGILGRRYFPAAQGIPEWALSHSYSMWSFAGEAKIGAPGQTVLPTVKAVKGEALGKIQEIPGAYEYTYSEIQAARAIGNPLDAMSQVGAHAFLERKVDNMIALGDPNGSITGALNHASINTTSGLTGGWATATAAQILNDIFLIVQQTMDALDQAAEGGGLEAPAFTQFTLLVPVKQDMILKKPRSDTSDTSIKQWLLQNLENVVAIEPWRQCKGAGAGATDRMMLYPRNPLAIEAVVNQEFTSLAPQPQDLNIRIPCMMKCGGTRVRYPIACRYGDSI